MEKLATVQEVVIKSQHLQRDMTVMVYLPTTFSSLYKYSVLFVQDGQDYFNLGKLPRHVEELMKQRALPNTMIVGIPYASVEERRSMYHPEGEWHQAYKRFLVSELAPYIDAYYPTYQMGHGRILVGDSLGGTVSLLTALQFPNTFGKVIMQSPFVDESVIATVQQFNDIHLVEMYHSIGTEETAVQTTNGEVKDFILPNRQLAKVVAQKGFTHTYHEFKGDHTWTYWVDDLPEALRAVVPV